LQRAGRDVEAHRKLFEEAKPGFVLWLARINKFIDRQEAANKKESVIARGVADGFGRLMIWLCLVSIGLAVVEAARAREVGAGLAVVADEVRNLARRAAAAACETADKIADAAARSKQGVEIYNRVSVGFEQILAKVREVDARVAEVANASEEQSTGLGHISKAVSQIDNLTQANTASAPRLTWTASAPCRWATPAGRSASLSWCSDTAGGCKSSLPSARDRSGSWAATSGRSNGSAECRMSRSTTARPRSSPTCTARRRSSTRSTSTLPATTALESRHAGRRPH
jgi:hypothetical protein